MELQKRPRLAALPLVAHERAANAVARDHFAPSLMRNVLALSSQPARLARCRRLAPFRRRVRASKPSRFGVGDLATSCGITRSNEIENVPVLQNATAPAWSAANAIAE
jgi:hypothetical protein